MAELYLRTVDKIGTTLYLDAQCTKRGDVIAVQPDGSPWGTIEQTSADHRILRVEALSLSEAEAFLPAELPVDPVNPSRTLQSRAFKVDLDYLSVWIPGFAEFLLGRSNRAPVFVVPGADGADLVRAAKRQKPRIPDPAVMGSATDVIG